MSSSLSKPRKIHLVDVLIIIIIASLSAFFSFKAAGVLPDDVVYSESTKNSWFESDVYRVFDNMIDRGSNHYRTKVHPIFSLVAYSPVYAMGKLCDIPPLKAVHIVMAAVCALWSACFYILLKLITRRCLDAVLFTLLALTSSAAMFWFSVPETYPLGSLSIVLAFILAVCAQSASIPQWGYMLVSAATFSFTVTNWMAGVFATRLGNSTKRTLQITVNAFALITLLWGIQKTFFPSAAFFIGSREELEYVMLDNMGGPWRVLVSFFFHSMIMPAINLHTLVNRPEWPLMTVQLSSLGSASYLGISACIIWAILLVFGGWMLFALKAYKKLRMMLILMLAGQLGLHLVYGNETFLYALHFMPILVVLVSLSSLGRLRKLILFLTVVLIFLSGLNNTKQFFKASEYYYDRGTQRQQVLTQMHKRSQDSWPRNKGHIILAQPGSVEAAKAYHEPGGNFSPTVGSFGVSLWYHDKDDALKFTSETILEKDIQQNFVWQNNEVPLIETSTEYYQTLWSIEEANQWQLVFNDRTDDSYQTSLMIRSVGPSGGPIHSIQWDNPKLIINQRYELEISPHPLEIYMAEEGGNQWASKGKGITQLNSKNGWAFARLKFSQHNETFTLTIKDIQGDSSSAPFPKPTSLMHLDIPDDTFVNSLKAQQAHLLMGLVQDETRPGDPTHYPLEWLRDGAYVVVALAKSGYLDTARVLSRNFAEQDFFGGFGAEADAPGLSLWVLDEISSRINDRAYDEWAWPHIVRKVKLIQEMIAAKQKIYHSYTGLLYPGLEKKLTANLVADPSENGLIIGKMDHHRPVLYVNAVSFLGLKSAANMAERLGKKEVVENLMQTSASLRKAWHAALDNPAYTNNSRTFISGLWPDQIAANDKSKYRKLLEARWNKRVDSQGEYLGPKPLWTYFEVAEGHQWLFLNDMTKVWTRLHWFWAHQDSPGLFSWWEGEGGESSFELWEHTRGWATLPTVTPHYWTAAEILSLQLDMLVYTPENSLDSEIIIGAGVPKEWLSHPFGVKHMSIPGGTINWHWDGSRVVVQTSGRENAVIKLGPSFPPTTPIDIIY